MVLKEDFFILELLPFSNDNKQHYEWASQHPNNDDGQSNQEAVFVMQSCPALDLHVIFKPIYSIVQWHTVVQLESCLSKSRVEEVDYQNHSYYCPSLKSG